MTSTTAAVLLLLLTIAASAQAVQIGVVHHPGLNAQVLQFVGDGDRDTPSIFFKDGGPPQVFEYSSRTTPVAAAGGCTPTSPTEGTCNGPVEYVLVFGEGGSDDITLSLCALGSGVGCGSVVTGIAFGGPGDDTLTGNVSSAFETQNLPTYAFGGDDGNDRLDGASGADELNGDAGNDVLQAATAPTSSTAAPATTSSAPRTRATRATPTPAATASTRSRARSTSAGATVGSR